MIASPYARRTLAVAALLLLTAPDAPRAAEPRRVAVLEFTASWAGPCAAPDRKAEVAERCEALLLLTDEARAGALEVLRPPTYLVMTRENTADLLKQMGGPGGACAEGECEVETARLVGAGLVVSGQVTVLEGTWIASVKLHDVKSAALLGATKARGRSQLELLDALKREVELLARKALGGGAAAGPRPFAREGVIEAQPQSGLGADAEESLVSFESTPEGASVLVDGQLLCRETPCRKRLGTGAHEASFQRERHVPSAQRFTAAKGAVVRATLAPTFGWLAVETVPSGVGVAIDGVDAGKSPVAWREADAGAAEVVVSDPCYLRSGERVAAKAGERRKVTLKATPRIAGLKVNAEDEKGNALESDVVVDGVAAGPAGSTLEVPLCARRVSVKLGQETFEQELKLEEGKVAVVVAKPGAGGAAADGMVRLSGGTFKIGLRGDPVTVAPFLLDETEVTDAAYAACVKAGKCGAPGLGGACNWGRADRAPHPVNCVDGNQASAYCAAMGKRLPTEAEWEWAARGAERGTTYAWGNGPPGDQLCWDGEGSDLGRGNRQSTCAVGRFPRGDSPQGLKDLAGNVGEWTSSAFDSSKRVYRGGSWSDDDAASVAASTRNGIMPVNRFHDLGFRCARTP